MAKAPKQEYTGTWIPAEIMLDDDLKGADKILYAEIASFKVCFANNAWFAKRIGTTPRTVINMLNKLEAKGYIARAGEDGDRTLVALGGQDPCKFFMGGMKNFHGGCEKFSHIDNKENKKEKNPTEAQALSPDFSVDEPSPQAGDSPPLRAAPPAQGDMKSQPAETTTHALHYRVIKKYGLPVSNHLHIKAKSKALDAEVGPEVAQTYLSRLLSTDYQKLVGDFKPGLNHSRDIYDKRIQITRFLDDMGISKESDQPRPEGQLQKGETPFDYSKRMYENKEWGF